ncbi:hypothetical protein BT96DRAFT_1022991 [Gymnopus androsaceus JB14]|uniref:Uncharacterized protein n=1 Tax=Gymnopus androsaceus JB14 TaxID=1447944 RepID=A0A6A4H860_9AGAR|nr:hypothetical protein BT96DRAFT_1022991 [Gymnopus androsaceus JB14]
MESVDAQLVLRGLSSVFEVPLDDDDDEISTHHASFYDFLRDSRRSQIFYYECIEEYTREGSPLYRLIPFITSLPPSAELLPLIQAMNPDYIFRLQELEMMIPWMKNIHPAPKDLIGLWEDYLYMDFIWLTTEWMRTDPMGCIVMFQMLEPHIDYLNDLRWLLDISWIDLKTAICGLRSIIGRDDTKLSELYYSLPHPSLPGEPFPWPSVSRDIACRCIHIAKDVHAGELPKETLRCFSIYKWSLQVRLSPPSPELLRDLRSFQPLVHECGADDIYHVLKWLESFPDPPLEVIVDWTQYLSDIQVMHPYYKFDPSTAEDKWTRRQKWINDIKLSFQHCRSPVQKTLTNV